MVSHDLAVVAHMCERLMVMQNGEKVEALDAEALAMRTVKTDYTRALLAASEGFRQDLAVTGAAFGGPSHPRRQPQI